MLDEITYPFLNVNGCTAAPALILVSQQEDKLSPLDPKTSSWDSTKPKCNNEYISKLMAEIYLFDSILQLFLLKNKQDI